MPSLAPPASREPEVVQAPAASELPGLDSPDGLTLGDLEQIALESNPTLVQARMAVRGAQGEYLQAGLYPNPTIGYAGADVGLDGTSGQQGAVLGQEFVTAGKLRLGRAVAGWEVQQARHGWEAQRLRVLNDVRAGYYEVLLAQRMIKLNEELVRIAEQCAEVTEKLAPIVVSQVDVLQAQIEAETVALGLNEAQNHHRGAWRRLAAVLGRPEMEPVPLAGDVDGQLPAFSWQDSLARLLSQSPELADARAGVERAHCQVAHQCAQRVPNVEVELGAKYDETGWVTLADVGVSLPLPLFDRNQGNIVKAQADLIAAQKEVRRVELDLCDRLASTFEQYAIAQRQAETYAGTILPHAEALLEKTRIGYREGEFGYLTLLTAQRTYSGVRLDYLTRLSEFWARSVEIEGMLLTGGLEGPE